MKNLRNLCRENRRQLTHQQQIEHARQATARLLKTPWLQRPKKIALFLTRDGELDTQPLIHALWQTHHQLYLPVLRTLRGRPMAFARYTPTSLLHKNHFGILEPAIAQQHHLSGRQMDLIIMPLTCFDEEGNRIGMGGGFYDRTFAFKHLQSAKQLSRPKLVGWAHECQKIEGIPSHPWDVAMDALMTEKQLYLFRKK